MSYKITDELPTDECFVCVWKHKGGVFSNSFSFTRMRLRGYTELSDEEGFYDDFLPWESENPNITDIKFIVEEK